MHPRWMRPPKPECACIIFQKEYSERNTLIETLSKLQQSSPVETFQVSDCSKVSGRFQTDLHSATSLI